MNVLVSDAGYKNTLGIVRALGKENINVNVISTSRYDISAYSRYCTKKIFIEKLNIQEIKNFV